jgi:hypothetical protein
LDAPAPVLALVRAHAGAALLCAFNLGSAPARFTVPGRVEPMPEAGFTSALEGATIDLPGYGAFFGRLSEA